MHHAFTLHPVFKDSRDIEDFSLTALSYLSTTEKSLWVGRIYLQGFVAIFQGFVRSVQTELSQRNIQIEGKQSRLDPLVLRIAQYFPVSQQCHSLWANQRITTKYAFARNGITSASVYLFIAIFGIVISALVEATVAKAPQCADNFKKCG